MLKDIHFKFNGFHGSAGRCQIRFARESKTTPLVIVCSQYKNYYGTSITNALEIIAESLFYQVANKKISGVAFDEPLPIIERWHTDANVFDKLLAKIYPEKYGNRFSTLQLDISKIFAKIVWVENYPIDIKSFSVKKHVSVVTLDTSGNPTWHGNPTSEWLEKKTGFLLDELLPNDDRLDLNSVEAKVETYPSAEEELKSFPGYHQVRWTKELLEFLSGLLSTARVYRGRSSDAAIEELSIHDEIEKFLAVKLPARELFEREFKFSKRLNIHTKGKEKAVDFALFTPNGVGIDALIEIKRTSSASPNLLTEVKKDLARLLLLSKHFRCSCYLLVCGNAEVILSELFGTPYLSLTDEDKSRDRRYVINLKDFDSEYGTLLNRFHIESGASKLQGIATTGSYLSALWQISVSEEILQMHKPYIFTLGDITH